VHYVLIHSPLVGPGTWTPVARELERAGRAVTLPSLLGIEGAAPPRWRFAVETIAAALEATQGPLALVGHSGAGALLPQVAAEAGDRCRAIVFVDAVLPPRSGMYATDDRFLALLRPMAADGRLPPWSEWWGEEAMRQLVPDDALRGAIEAELPRLPLAYFEEAVPVPAGWDRVPVAHLRFSDAYWAEGEEAERRGYRVEQMVGSHLHAVIEPARVAERIVALAEAGSIDVTSRAS
jgi:pimeloyl-ACP methyl ester carboxylesterase